MKTLKLKYIITMWEKSYTGGRCNQKVKKPDTKRFPYKFVAKDRFGNVICHGYATEITPHPLTRDLALQDAESLWYRNEYGEYRKVFSRYHG